MWNFKRCVVVAVLGFAALSLLAVEAVEKPQALRGSAKQEKEKVSMTAWDQIASDVKAVTNSSGGPARLLVTYKKDDKKPLDAQAESKATSSSVLKSLHLKASSAPMKVKVLPNVAVGVVELPFDTSVQTLSSAAHALLEMDHIASVESDAIMRIPMDAAPNDRQRLADVGKSVASVTPNDKFFNRLWSMQNMRASEAWTIATGAEPGAHRTKVVIIDSGVDRTHPDLKDNYWVNEAELSGTDGVDDDGNGYVDDVYGWNAINGNGYPEDDDGHGTHVAGSLGAVSNNAEGVTGANWAPVLVGCKFINAEGWGYQSDAIECIDYSIAIGAEVTNNSWGGKGKLDSLQSAIERSAASGQTFVAAAGNSGVDLEVEPRYPACMDSPNMIVVAAIDKNNVKPSWSNFAPSIVDIAAPGVNILSTYKVGEYFYMSGTSMAAPHVAGAVSLMKSLKPSISSEEIKNTLQSTSTSFQNWASYVKWGKLDFYEAMAAVQKTLTTTTTQAPTTEGPTTETPSEAPQPPDYVIMVPSLQSCNEGCRRAGWSCDNDAMQSLNTDVTKCYEALVASELSEKFILGKASAEWRQPTGCHLTPSFLVAVNTNAFGTDNFGCNAPVSSRSESLKICACKKGVYG